MTIALWVGPIVAAFASNNWDLKATVMPSEDQISGVKDQVENIIGGEFSENILEITDNQINLTTGEFEAKVEFKSPFNINVEITEFSLGISCEQHDMPLGSVQMEEQEVNVSANGAATLTLVGTLTSQGTQHIDTVHRGVLPSITLTNSVLELEAYGVTVRMENMMEG